MEGKGIVLKKGKKAPPHGGHGSAWKVAYADFVTAMMAFFLLLWLLTMVEPEKRARLSNYFKEFSIFEKGGASFMEVTPKEDLVDLMKEKGMTASKGKRPTGLRGTTARELEEMKERLKNEIESKLSDAKDQVLVDIFEGGVRIQLMDKDGSPMFPLGSSELTLMARRILLVISESIKEEPSKVAIEGHTDAYGYSTNRYTNWELSTDRASAARKELEGNGLDPRRLIRVAGFAATEPLIKENPFDPRNRRISILLYKDSQNGSSPDKPTLALARTSMR